MALDLDMHTPRERQEESALEPRVVERLEVFGLVLSRPQLEVRSVSVSSHGTIAT